MRLCVIGVWRVMRCVAKSDVVTCDRFEVAIWGSVVGCRISQPTLRPCQEYLPRKGAELVVGGQDSEREDRVKKVRSFRDEIRKLFQQKGGVGDSDYMSKCVTERFIGRDLYVMHSVHMLRSVMKYQALLLPILSNNNWFN